MRNKLKLAVAGLAASAVVGITGCSAIDSAIADAKPNTNSGDYPASLVKPLGTEVNDFWKNVDAIQIANGNDGSGYDRSKQYPTWKTGNAKIEKLTLLRQATLGPWPEGVKPQCQVDKAILIRDGYDVKTDNSCKVLSGTWPNSYQKDKPDITFERPAGSKRAMVPMDIDHIIPLGYVYQHETGGAWDKTKRTKIANDPMNLVAAPASANRAKGDKGPAEWLGSQNKRWEMTGVFRCMYAARGAAVMAHYGVSGTEQDVDVLRQTGEQCQFPKK